MRVRRCMRSSWSSPSARVTVTECRQMHLIGKTLLAKECQTLDDRVSVLVKALPSTKVKTVESQSPKQSSLSSWLTCVRHLKPLLWRRGSAPRWTSTQSQLMPHGVDAISSATSWTVNPWVMLVLGQSKVTSLQADSPFKSVEGFFSL